MDSMTCRIGEDIKSSENVAEGMVKSLEEQLQTFTDSVSDRSALHKQLSAS